MNEKYFPRLSCALSSDYELYPCCHHDCELPDNDHDTDYEWKVIEHRCSCCKNCEKEPEKPKGMIT